MSKRLRRYLAGLLALAAIVGSWWAFDTREDFEARRIVMGASVPLCGINRELGEAVATGAKVAFANAESYSGGRVRRVDLLIEDDKYEPQNTIRNTRHFLEKERVFALFGYVGTPTVKAVLSLLGETPLVAPYTGAPFLYRNPSRKIVTFRRSYQDEIEHIVDYLYDTKGLRRFAIFYQNDDYGIAGYDGTIRALKRRGLSLVAEGTYKRNTLSILHALYELRRSSPEAILIVGAYKPSARFIRRWRREVSKETIFAPISFVNADALIRELDYRGEGIYFSSTVPSYDDNSTQIAREYLRDLVREAPGASPSFASFEAYLAARATLLAMGSLEGPLTPSSFWEATRTLGVRKMSGVKIHFLPGPMFRRLYIFRYKEGRFQPVGAPNE